MLLLSTGERNTIASPILSCLVVDRTLVVFENGAAFVMYVYM